MQNIETDSTTLPFIRERLKLHSTQLYPDDCRAAVLLPLLIKKGEPVSYTHLVPASAPIVTKTRVKPSTKPSAFRTVRALFCSSPPAK